MMTIRYSFEYQLFWPALEFLQTFSWKFSKEKKSDKMESLSPDGVNLLYEASRFECQRDRLCLIVWYAPQTSLRFKSFIFSRMPLTKGSCLTKSFPRDKTISSDWSLQGYIASTPLPRLEHYFRTPCRLAEATVATLSQFESSFCSVPLPLCYSINCLQISPSPRVLHLWIQLDIILSFILYML